MKIQHAFLVPAMLASACTAAFGAQQPAADPMAPYDILFSSPSKDEADSIPLGNGTTGIGLWAEEDGDLLFYLARNDAVSEMHRLVKLGRIRIHFSPNPFAKGSPFSQRLVLRGGCCEITAGKKGSEIRLRVFVDSDSQTVHVSGTADQPVAVTATLENWRTKARALNHASGELGSSWVYRDGTGPKALGAKNEEVADVVLANTDAVTWYHRNEHSPVAVHIAAQHLEAVAGKIRDPLLHLTFGATIFGPGFVSSAPGVLTLKKPAQPFDLRIATHAAQTASADAFLKELTAQAAASTTPAKAAERTRRWWDSFWNRSWIFVAEAAPPLIPGNRYALHAGAGRAGDISLGGSFGRIAVYDQPLTTADVARLAATPRDRIPPGPAAFAGPADFTAQGAADPAAGEFKDGFLAAKNSVGWTFPKGFTMEAWIKPAGEGRIFDKITPGGSDGMLFDNHGGKLRLIIGGETFLAGKPLPLKQWSHVAVVGEPGGRFTLYQDGKRAGGSEAEPAPRTLSQVTQAYILTRYQFACQERSSMPAHFNGGIFTVAPEFAYYATDPRGKNWNADYRFYGPSLWWQNTRFMYQLHLAQGNFDLMDSFYDFYFRNQEAFEAMAKTYYNANGIYMNETLSLFGLPGMGDFGWGASEYSNGYTRNIWQQALEFGSIALDRYDYTGDPAFLKKTIHWCDKALSFYDTRFKKDTAGKIVIFPSHGVETYWTGVTDDMPSIAGLHEITARLLALPDTLITPEQRARWQSIAKAAPDLPKTRNKQGQTVPDVARLYNPARSNYEAPDLYCVYPFRIYGLGRTQHDIEEARRAWADMVNKGHCCWYQTGIFAARLGLIDGAKEDVLLRSGNATRLRVANQRSREFRFPGYYGSPHDWCPDYDGAGNMANTLQEMLLQPGPDRQLLLLPAWPADWNVSFKLHAPGCTTVECVYRNGRIEKLEVVPKERAKDLVLPAGMAWRARDVR